jgi:hypothetical protein
MAIDQRPPAQEWENASPYYAYVSRFTSGCHKLSPDGPVALFSSKKVDFIRINIGSHVGIVRLHLIPCALLGKQLRWHC